MGLGSTNIDITVTNCQLVIRSTQHIDTKRLGAHTFCRWNIYEKLIKFLFEIIAITASLAGIGILKNSITCRRSRTTIKDNLFSGMRSTLPGLMKGQRHVFQFKILATNSVRPPRSEDEFLLAVGGFVLSRRHRGWVDYRVRISRTTQIDITDDNREYRYSGPNGPQRLTACPEDSRWRNSRTPRRRTGAFPQARPRARAYGPYRTLYPVPATGR